MTSPRAVSQRQWESEGEGEEEEEEEELWQRQTAESETDNLEEENSGCNEEEVRRRGEEGKRELGNVSL